MNKGWISLHRKFLDWQWYTDANVMRLFLHLLLKANHKPKKWRDIDIDRGQLITGRKQLSSELHLSEQVIRTCLKKLEKTNEITVKSTNKYSIVTVCKYDSYQNIENEINQQDNQQITNKQPTNNQQITTTNNVNNINNDNNVNKNVGEEKNQPPHKILINNWEFFGKPHQLYLKLKNDGDFVNSEITQILITEELAKMQDHFAAKPEYIADWYARFRNWIRTSYDLKPPKKTEKQLNNSTILRHDTDY